MKKYVIIEELEYMDYSVEIIEAESAEKAIQTFIEQEFNSNIVTLAIRGANTIEDLTKIWDYFSGTNIKYVFDMDTVCYEKKIKSDKD